MHVRVSNSVSRVLSLAFVALMPVALCAQAAPTPSSKAAANDTPSRWDIFAGYSYLWAHGTVQSTQYSGAVVPYKFNPAEYGSVISVARYFNRTLGLQIDTGEHDRLVGHVGESNMGAFTVQAGPIVRYPKGDFTSFAHALAGGGQLEGPDHQGYTPGFGFLAGGGLDLNTPLFNHHLALRLFDADYEFLHVNYGQPHLVSNGMQAGGIANLNSLRLSAGLVYHIGSVAPPPQAELACQVNPTAVYAGDPVAVTCTPSNLNPKLSVNYNWTGTGVTGGSTTATVATGALEPGTYTVKASLEEGKRGKSGLKAWQVADSSVTYTVKPFEPPTISCSANPTTLNPGDSAIITASGVSPQNRPLTYSYSATGGSISGNGATAKYSSTGAPTGVVGITCNVSDDKGHTGTSTASVILNAPYVAPIPHTQALCNITFDKDKARPTRVDNEAKACLDQVALDLQKQSDAKAVVVGESDAKEKAKTAKDAQFAEKHKHAKVDDLAAERAVNSKEYLVTDKGIDASRIAVATGATDGKTVEDYLVPSGATFSADVKGTTPVDETAVKPVARKPLPSKHRHAKKTAK
jgi:outer membrane protein OmpA-like peptidoglycan-associated protein